MQLLVQTPVERDKVVGSFSLWIKPQGPTFLFTFPSMQLHHRFGCFHLVTLWQSVINTVHSQTILVIGAQCRQMCMEHKHRLGAHCGLRSMENVVGQPNKFQNQVWFDTLVFCSMRYCPNWIYHIGALWNGDGHACFVFCRSMHKQGGIHEMTKIQP